MNRRAVVTGGSGCVGHYLVEALARSGWQVTVIVRDPAKLSPVVSGLAGVSVVVCDLRDASALAGHMASADALVLNATSWGGPDVDAVNIEANSLLADQFSRNGGRRLVYFGTASVLDRDGQLLAAAAEHGTDYIRSKHRLVAAMEAFSHRCDVVGLFPTLVIGGDAQRPMSHFARILRAAAPWVRPLGLLSADARLHMIHASDVAGVAAAVLSKESTGSGTASRLVLGMPAMTANAVIEEFCRYFGVRARGWVTIDRRLVRVLSWLPGIRLSAWDWHCLANPDQSYAETVMPATFGVANACSDFSAALKSIGLHRDRRG